MVMAFAAIAAYFEAKNFLNKKIASTAYDKASDLVIFKYKEVMDLLTKAHTELSFYLFAIQNNVSDDLFNRIEKDKFVDLEVITPMIRAICDIKTHLDKLGWVYNDEALRLHHSLVLNMSSLQLLQISCYGSILSVLECIKKDESTNFSRKLLLNNLHDMRDKYNDLLLGFNSFNELDKRVIDYFDIEE
ncbi:hypothetical protein [Mangrovibacter plantisponsor]|nr:hypothetical protein [Mangrovibacter plantisponsor]